MWCCFDIKRKHHACENWPTPARTSPWIHAGRHQHHRSGLIMADLVNRRVEGDEAAEERRSSSTRPGVFKLQRHLDGGKSARTFACDKDGNRAIVETADLQTRPIIYAAQHGRGRLRAHYEDNAYSAPSAIWPERERTQVLPSAPGLGRTSPSWTTRGALHVPAGSGHPEKSGLDRFSPVLLRPAGLISLPDLRQGRVPPGPSKGHQGAPGRREDPLRHQAGLYRQDHPSTR